MRSFRLACRKARPVSLLFAAFLVALPVAAQTASPTPTTSDPQAVALLQGSLAALTNGAQITDVTMEGTVSVNKTGALTRVNWGPTATAETKTLIATDTGQSQETTVTPAGTEVVVRGVSAGVPVLSVTGTDGATHVIDTWSALTPHPAWFYPAFLLHDALSSSYVASYVGQETWEGVPVVHIAIWRSASGASASASFKAASEHEVYLDPTSLLPVGTAFVVHAYDPKNPNKPIMPYRGKSPDRIVEVRYLDYQQVQGRPVAMEIQSSTDIIPSDSPDDLVSTIQISSVTFNTGITITTPAN